MCESCQADGGPCQVSKRRTGGRKRKIGVGSASQAGVRQNPAYGTISNLPEVRPSVSAGLERDRTEEQIGEKSLYMGLGSGLRRGFMTSHRVG